jgi:PAS domain S-box-containing protein
MNKKIKILHLEDSLKDSELIQSLIKSGEIVHDYFLADNEKDYLKILKNENIDLILCDNTMPGFNGNEALKLAKEKCSDIPFIFISGTMEEEAGINALLNGARDYVLKNNLVRLIPAIKRTLKEHEIETKSKLAERAMHEIEERYRSLFYEDLAANFITSLDGKIILCNKAFANMFGLNSIDEALKLNVNTLYHSSKDRGLFLNQINKRKKLESYELVLIRPDGKIITVLTNTYGKFDSTKELVQLHGNLIDITERKIAEQELIISNRELIIAKVKAEESDKLKSAFLANISHEIRTPLNAILGFAELLKNHEIDNSKKEKYVDIINISGHQLLHIINDIMDISNIEAGKEKIHNVSFNLNNIMNELNAIFQTDKIKKELDIFFYNGLSDPSSYIFGDPLKLKQILTNLIGNALKFTIKEILM